MDHAKDSAQTKLTSSEWSVLTCLWESSPRTVMQLVSDLAQRVGWAKSTTITTLRRMEEKGLVRVEQGALAAVPGLTPGGEAYEAARLWAWTAALLAGIGLYLWQLKVMYGKIRRGETICWN